MELHTWLMPFDILSFTKINLFVGTGTYMHTSVGWYWDLILDVILTSPTHTHTKKKEKTCYSSTSDRIRE
jgi:hypothetical protein